MDTICTVSLDCDTPTTRRLYPFGARTVRSSRPSNRFLDGFPDPSQFAAAKLTHYSSKPRLPSDSSRSWPRILLPRDVHPNPGPTIKYPCPVCARNDTGRGVSYLCNRCSRWVHSKCSGLQNAAEYRRIKDWVCSSCSCCCCLPTPMTLASGGVRCSRLWSTSQHLRPSGQQCSHSGGVCPQIQGRQCGAYVGAVEEMMCVVCVDVTEGA